MFALQHGEVISFDEKAAERNGTEQNRTKKQSRADERKRFHPPHSILLSPDYCAVLYRTALCRMYGTVSFSCFSANTSTRNILTG
jgi:hypothetical protein